MKIVFEISNIADEPDYVHPSAAVWAEMKGLIFADLELPLDEFVERYIRPLVKKGIEEFNQYPPPVRPGSALPSSADAADPRPEKPPE